MKSQFTGRHMVLTLVAFFGVVMAVNFTMAVESESRTLDFFEGRTGALGQVDLVIDPAFTREA